jgi:hypothetical protein
LLPIALNIVAQPKFTKQCLPNNVYQTLLPILHNISVKIVIVEKKEKIRFAIKESTIDTY